MKTALAYPKIPDTSNCPLKKCWAFEKYDGTNMHFTLDTRTGSTWSGFGTRRDYFEWTDEGWELFYQAHPEMKSMREDFEKISYHLSETLCKQLTVVYQAPVVFAEWFGPNSFAGSHRANDKKELRIFDIQINGKFLSPEELVTNFASCNLAKVIYTGKYSGQLVEDIRNGKYPVVEGAVIKGIADKELYMAKVKTNTYLKKLQEQFKDNWQDYWE